MSQMLAGTQPTGVPPLSSKYRTPVTLRCVLNLFPGISRDENHVVITGSNPITVMEQACSMILCNDTRSVSAETGKQWFLPILFLLTLNVDMVLNSVCWRWFHVSLLIGYRCQTIWDYFKPDFPRVKIQTVTPEADVGPFSPLRNVVWHPSRLSLWGKRKLNIILACLVSSFQNLHECAMKKKKPHPFSLCLHRD